MEKPAVIFSEAGFKMFLDFVKGVQEAKGNPVDDLVKEYFARPDKPDLTTKSEESDDTKYDMEDLSRVVAAWLQERSDVAMSSDSVQKFLHSRGFEYTTKAVAPVMRGVMNRYPEVHRVGTGEYQWVQELFADDEE